MDAKKAGKAGLQFCSCSLVGQHYIQSLMFGAMPTSDKKGNYKTPLSDLTTIVMTVMHPLSPPST